MNYRSINETSIERAARLTQRDIDEAADFMNQFEDDEAHERYMRRCADAEARYWEDQARKHGVIK